MVNKWENKLKKLREIGQFTSIPIILLVGPALGFFIGNYLDNKLNTSPWLMIFFMVIGAAASVKEIINIILKRDANNGK